MKIQDIVNQHLKQECCYESVICSEIHTPSFDNKDIVSCKLNDSTCKRNKTMDST